MDMDIPTVSKPLPNRSGMDVSGNTTSFAFLWFDDLIGKALHDASQVIRHIGGVISAEVSQSKASVLIVEYDRLQTSATSIVNSVRQKGLDALLVGC